MQNIKTLSALKRAIKIGTKIRCTYCRSLEREQATINRRIEINNLLDKNILAKRQSELDETKEKMYSIRTVSEIHSSYIMIDNSRLDWPKASNIEIIDEGFDVYCEEYIDREKQRNKILSYTVEEF